MKLLQQRPHALIQSRLPSKLGNVQSIRQDCTFSQWLVILISRLNFGNYSTYQGGFPHTVLVKGRCSLSLSTSL